MFNRVRSTRLAAGVALAVSCLVVGTTVATESPAQATPTTLKLAVFQGNLTAWVTAAGGGTTGVNAVAADLSGADILLVTNAFLHSYGGSEWTNPSGCGDYQSDHTALVNVLARLATIKPSEQIYGYVSGPADAPDQVISGSTQPALCGNTVNNFLPGSSVLQPDGVTHSLATTNSSCPSGVCSDFIQWTNQWANASDPLHSYIDGIFIDYVNAQKMSSTIRDNEYSYVHALGLKVMANSTLPGEPCSGCSGADLNGDLGTTENYSFAADSSYLTSSDYVLVEGYWYAGFNGNGGVATSESTPTNAIASVRFVRAWPRSTPASSHGSQRWSPNLSTRRSRACRARGLTSPRRSRRSRRALWRMTRSGTSSRTTGSPKHRREHPSCPSRTADSPAEVRS